MEENTINRITDGPARGQGEEDLGIFGPPVTESDLQRIQKEQTRRDLYARMAANMIIEDKPRSTYFVRQPGL